MERYYQKEIETASREEIRAIQTEKLKKQVQHVWNDVPFYRKKMEEAGVTPDDIQSIDDLCKLPFTTKDDLKEQYPYGLLGKPLKECVRIQSTSGTTGKRVVAFYTQHDPAQPANASSLSTPSMTSISGKTAAHVRSLRQEEPMRMYARYPTATVSSPADPVSTAAPTRSAV